MILSLRNHSFSFTVDFLGSTCVHHPNPFVPLLWAPSSCRHEIDICGRMCVRRSFTSVEQTWYVICMCAYPERWYHHIYLKIDIHMIHGFSLQNASETINKRPSRGNCQHIHGLSGSGCKYSRETFILKSTREKH